MRRLEPILFSLALALPGAAAPAHAGENTGGSSGTRGGGEVVVFPDGGVVNADRYVRSPGRKWEIPDDVHRELQRAGYILTQFGAAPDEVLDSSWYSPPRRSARIIQQYVLNRRIRYVIGPSLPQTVEECQGPTTSVQGATVERDACTDGWVTWLREDLFLKLSPMAQAAKLVHEGLHRLPDSPSHEVIQEVSAGLEVAMRLHKEQTDDGLEPVLSEEPTAGEELSELELVQNLFDGMRNLGLTWNHDLAYFPQDWMIWRRGGALVHRSASVAWDAYVGVTTVLTSSSKVLQGAKVINSFCTRPGGWPCSLEIGDRAVLRNTSFTNVAYDKVTIGKQSVIEGSSVHMSWNSERPFQISPLSRSFVIGDDVRAKRLWIMGVPGSVSIGNGSILDEAIFWISTNLITLPVTYVQTPVSLVIGARSSLKQVKPYVSGPTHYEIYDRGAFVPVFEIPSGSSVDLSANPDRLNGCTVKVDHDRKRVTAKFAAELIAACSWAE